MVQSGLKWPQLALPCRLKGQTRSASTDSVIDWTYRNNLRLNHSKTKAIVFSTRHRISNLIDPAPFLADGYLIKFVKNHVYLGITLDNVMSLS